MYVCYILFYCISIIMEYIGEFGPNNWEKYGAYMESKGVTKIAFYFDMIEGMLKKLELLNG